MIFAHQPRTHPSSHLTCETRKPRGRRTPSPGSRQALLPVQPPVHRTFPTPQSSSKSSSSDGIGRRVVRGREVRAHIQERCVVDCSPLAQDDHNFWRKACSNHHHASLLVIYTIHRYVSFRARAALTDKGFGNLGVSKPDELYHRSTTTQSCIGSFAKDEDEVRIRSIN